MLMARPHQREVRLPAHGREVAGGTSAGNPVAMGSDAGHEGSSAPDRENRRTRSVFKRT